MKTALKLLAIAAPFALLSSVSYANCQHVVQNGQVSNSAPAIWIAECLIGQAGGSAGSTIVNGLPMYNDLGVMGPFGILDGPITGPYHQALFHWVGSSFVIDLNSVGGAGTPAAFLRVNGGALQPLPGSGGGGGFPPSLPNLSLQFNNSGTFGGYVVGTEFAINANTLGLAPFTGDVAKPTFGSLATTVIGLQGRPLSAAIPLMNQVIGWNGSFWGPITVGGGGGTIIPNAPLVGGNGSVLGSVALGANLTLSGIFPNQTLSATTGGTTIPNAPITSGNGSVLGAVALGTNLTLTGTFPNQTLNATGGGISAITGPVTASGTGSVPSTITPTGVAAGSYTVASSGGAFFCEVIAASGQVTSMTSGTCGGGGLLVGRNAAPGSMVGRNSGGSVERNGSGLTLVARNSGGTIGRNGGGSVARN